MEDEERTERPLCSITEPQTPEERRMGDDLLRIRDGLAPNAPVCMAPYTVPDAAPDMQTAPPAGNPAALKAMISSRRRLISSLGLRYLVFSALTFVIQIAAVVIGQLALSLETFSRWYYVLSMLPMYAIAYPLGILIISRVPKTGHLQQAVPFNPAMLLAAIPISFGFSYIGGIAGNILNILISSVLNREAVDTLSSVVMDMSLGEVFLFTCVFAPVLEELLFRKLLVDRLTRFGEKTAILVSAFAFGLFHGNVTQFVYATLIGLVLAYVYCKSGKLIWSILIHLAINFTSGFLSVLMLKSLDAGTVTDISQAVSSTESGIGTLVYLSYSSIVSLLSIAGLVMFTVFVLNKSTRRLHFSDGTERIVKGTRFKTIVLNPGALLFIVVWVTMMIVTILRS